MMGFSNEYSSGQTSDEALVSRLPGFKNGRATANGISLHYVSGGEGDVLVLVPGWPQTWWSFYKIMPALAERYHVIALDIRGMGSSQKPESGYEKQQMAEDISELMRVLGHQNISIAGHDIGASVAFSLASRHPELVAKLVVIDTPPPDENMYKLPMLPIPNMVHPWWVAFNQVKELPEKLLAGRMNIMLDWIFDQMLHDMDSIDVFSRSVYSCAYDTPEAIRASNAWYQAFPQDIRDFKEYETLQIPVLGMGGSGFDLLQASLPKLAPLLTLSKIEEAGHFIQSEKPEAVIKGLVAFLD